MSTQIFLIQNSLNAMNPWMHLHPVSLARKQAMLPLQDQTLGEMRANPRMQKKMKAKVTSTKTSRQN
jgi:hypothetical protein